MRYILPVLALALPLAACGDRDPARETGPASYVDRKSDTVAERAVSVGFDGPRFDACAGYGRVANLNRTGNNYLSVRAAPAGSAQEIDRLAPGRRVSMCQQVGDWIGVVYAPDAQEPVNCGTGSPVPDVRRYEGPCNSGWVNENFLTLIAG